MHMSSYQNNNLLQGNHSTYDGSITDLDSKNNTKNNILSYFNFMSSSNKCKKIKYYVVGLVIGVLLILVLLHITSNPGGSAVSTPLVSPINDKSTTHHWVSSSTPLVSPINDKSTDTSPQYDYDFCEGKDYFKKAIKEVYSQSIGGIIKNVEHAEKYEASGVIYDSSRDVYWVVFDSLYAIGKLTSDLTRNDNNLLVVSNVNGINENEKGLESGYEGITRDPDTDILYLLTEAQEFTDNNGNTVYHPVIRAVTYDEQETYTEQQMCVVDFLDPSDNKGFESLNLIEIDGQKYFVGLCEGNYCEKGSKGRDPGHGRMVLINYEAQVLTADDTDYKYLLADGIDCIYTVVDKYKLPKYIDFIDYSAFHILPKNNELDDNNGYFDIAVVSQESASVWIGEVEWTGDNGPNFDINKKDGKMYRFPKNDNCETVFCNVEGITFSTNNQIVTVSDKAKGDGKQPWVCGQYDQSIHIFQIP